MYNWIYKERLFEGKKIEGTLDTNQCIFYTKEYLKEKSKLIDEVNKKEYEIVIRSNNDRDGYKYLVY